MPRDLFGDVQQPSVRVGSRSRYSVPLSLAAHALAVLVVVGATILGPVVLPGLASGEMTYHIVTLPPVPPPPPSPVPTRATPPVNPNAAPAEAPSEIRPEPPARFELPDVSSPVTGLIPGVTSFETVLREPPAPPVASHVGPRHVSLAQPTRWIGLRSLPRGRPREPSGRVRFAPSRRLSCRRIPTLPSRVTVVAQTARKPRSRSRKIRSPPRYGGIADNREAFSATQ